MDDATKDAVGEGFEVVINLGGGYDTRCLRLEELTKAGYDKNKRALFIWEGVTQYISEEAIGGTLKYIASSQKGNRVAFSYVLKRYLQKPETFPKCEKLIKQVNMSGAKWICGLSQDGMNDYLEDYGLKLIEDVGTEEHRERHLLPIGRDVSVMPIERITLAEVAE